MNGTSSTRGRVAGCKSRGLYGKRKRKPDSYSDEWYTPARVVTALGPFDLDPCAGPMNHATTCYRQGGLDRQWFGRVWLNPPYSTLEAWIDRFVEHRNGILLMPARCETRLFQRATCNADSILFVRSRLSFEGPGAARSYPPCGSALIAMTSTDTTALVESNIDGILVAVFAARGPDLTNAR